MEIEWLIEEKDLDRIRELIKSQSNNPFVKKRIEKGITQKELAKKIDTRQSSISRFESGAYNPTLIFLLVHLKLHASHYIDLSNILYDTIYMMS